MIFSWNELILDNWAFVFSWWVLLVLSTHLKLLPISKKNVGLCLRGYGYFVFLHKCFNWKKLKWVKNWEKKRKKKRWMGRLGVIPWRPCFIHYQPPLYIIFQKYRYDFGQAPFSMVMVFSAHPMHVKKLHQY